MFTLDSFDGDKRLSEKILGFLIHLIPSYILIALLLIGWRWELAGGLILTLAGFIILPMHYQRMYAYNQAFFPTIWVSLATVGPIILWGLLFLLAYYKHRNDIVLKD
jgi:hypothetical protein